MVAAVVYAADRAAKALAVRELDLGHPVDVVPHVLRLQLVHNPGAAFGVAGGATVLFSVVAVAVIIAILRTARRLQSGPWALALGLLLGGALGNLTDRVVRPPGLFRGQVVDFLELPHWPVFNIADMAILGGAGVIVLLTLRGLQIDGTRDTGSAQGGGSAKAPDRPQPDGSEPDADPSHPSRISTGEIDADQTSSEDHGGTRG